MPPQSPEETYGLFVAYNKVTTELHLYAKYDAMAATTPNKMGAEYLLKQMQLNDSVDNPSGTRSDARYLTRDFRNTQ